MYLLRSHLNSHHSSLYLSSAEDDLAHCGCSRPPLAVRSVTASGLKFKKLHIFSESW